MEDKITEPAPCFELEPHSSLSNNTTRLQISESASVSMIAFKHDWQEVKLSSLGADKNSSSKPVIDGSSPLHKNSS